MSVFTQEFNPLTGKTEWQVQREDYDYQQEIARSAYADMLHDWERNKKYHTAIKSAISGLRKAHKPVRVLDIGTGSGLLAMMAAKYGADSVYACEAFQPVADCAKKVIEKNGLSHKIKLISKRSTELTVGPTGDLPERANLLVTEVFDTELIGEGALSTFKHAHENLLEKDCIVIPSTAVVYAQVVKSQSVLAFHRLSDIAIHGGLTIKVPASWQKCAGAPSVHDLQLSQLRANDFTPLTAPIIVKEFDFTSRNQLLFNESSVIEAKGIGSGNGEIVFMWWDIEMYPGGEILSCAPKWAHPNGPENLPWRDHWMQAVYHLQTPFLVEKDKSLFLGVHHDEYSFWFVNEQSTSEITSAPPVCDCGVHTSNSRIRVAMMNDCERYSAYYDALCRVENRDSKLVLVCDESVVLALMAAAMGFKMVYIRESLALKKDVIDGFVKANNLDGKIQVICKDFTDFGSKIDVLLAEPYFSSSVLQWDNLHFHYICSTMNNQLSVGATIIPNCATINGIAVHFNDLWKIRAPVVSTEGFDLSAFDDVIQSAITNSDAIVEPQPLWEYPCSPVSDQFTLIQFDFRNDIPERKELSGNVNLNGCEPCNGIALWMELTLADNAKCLKQIKVSLGPTRPIARKRFVEWYRCSQQGVHLFPNPATCTSLHEKNLSFKSDFSSSKGELLFNFELNDNVNDNRA